MFIFPASRMKAGGKSFPTGTITVFKQTAAPLGWTKITTTNDAGLRVVSGTVGAVTAGAAFSTVFAQTATGATSLSTAQLAAHFHNYFYGLTGCGGTFAGGASTGTGTAATDSTGQIVKTNGSGSSHTHPITLNLNYVDIILASKN